MLQATKSIEGEDAQPLKLPLSLTDTLFVCFAFLLKVKVKTAEVANFDQCAQKPNAIVAPLLFDPE